jgi:hypothetical protein
MRVSEGIQAQWHACCGIASGQRRSRNPALLVAANVSCDFFVDIAKYSDNVLTL